MVIWSKFRMGQYRDDDHRVRKWLENSVVKIENAALMPMMFNPLKYISC